MNLLLQTIMLTFRPANVRLVGEMNYPTQLHTPRLEQIVTI
jgi:hypothetical protein